MLHADIARFRLVSQQIARTRFETVKEIVAWMGAMQAQDYAMAKWALGVRLPDSSDQAIESAINNGEIIRTHLLRPTWHFASAGDVHWMLALTAPQIRASLRSRHQELGLSEEVVARSNGIIEKALEEAGRSTREELAAELRKAGFVAEDNRISHLLLRAELDGILCCGEVKAGKPIYTLLEERVPKTKQFTREEALANLAKRYFASHGPAAIQDFIWWSGLSVNDAKHALEMVKPDFLSETIASQTYWFSDPGSTPGAGKEAVYLLPAYDEFIISYKDRSASLPSGNRDKTISNNGIFRPVIVVNGQVAGIWKRAIKRDQVRVETEFFERPDEITARPVEKASLQYGRFLGKKVEVKHKS